MMEHIFIVENIKCGGCESTIRKALLKIPNVEDVSVSFENGAVRVKGDADRTAILTRLYDLGYPEKGHNSVLVKAKSYVSCAIGKVNKKSGA
jgi:copper chaperone